MPKPTIFLSHITEEAELAGIFKEVIEKSFLGLVDVFVSSDANTITLGRNWLDTITEGLRTCQAMLLLCSKPSIARPWINFECGAGWSRSIEVAPICHSGLRPVDLPLPMSLLQGVLATDEKRLAEVFVLIAKQLGSAPPAVDMRGLVARIQEFERTYSIEITSAPHLRALRGSNSKLFQLMKAMEPNKISALNGVLERDYIHIRPQLDALEAAGLLQHSFAVQSMTIGGSSGGSFGPITLQISNQLADVLAKLK